MRFENKVVLITGASGNVGGAGARAYAAEGAKLALVARSTDSLEQLAGDLDQPADRVHIDGTDVTDPGAVDGLIERIAANLGPIEVLAHTVGGFYAGTPVHETDIDVWEKMLALNARSVFVTCGRVVAHMLEQGTHGKIVAVLARTAYKGSKNAAAYSAGKAAAQRVLESMSSELKAKGINVNAVLPGNIDTPENRAAMPNKDFSKWVKPADIADAILFLTSGEADAVHGAGLDILGGV